MASGIKLKLNGFEEYIEKIRKADGDIDAAFDELAKSSADAVNDELKNQMSKAKVSSSLINRMPPPKIKKTGNRYQISAGYNKGEYDPNNPSDAYKAIFVNYGTPKHKKANGEPWIKGRGFIQKAKRTAKPKIKKAQEKALERILGELE